MIILLLAGASALAEQEYYTWVDAQGRIHNSPKPTSDKTADKQLSTQKKGTAPKELSRDDFQSEEEFIAAEQQFKQDHPPFYTWVDGEGRLRSERIPDGEAPKVVLEDHLVTDHTLLPHDRVGDLLNDFECCQPYEGFFKERLKPLKGVMFNRPQFAPFLKTPDGNFHAWFVYLPSVLINGDKLPHLRLRLRESDDELAVLVLDKNLAPLHLIPQLERQYFAATWKSIPMYETLIAVADPDVHALIIYFPAQTSSKTTLEVEWRP